MRHFHFICLCEAVPDDARQRTFDSDCAPSQHCSTAIGELWCETQDLIRSTWLTALPCWAENVDLSTVRKRNTVQLDICNSSNHPTWLGRIDCREVLNHGGENAFMEWSSFQVRFSAQRASPQPPTGEAIVSYGPSCECRSRTTADDPLIAFSKFCAPFVR